MSATTHSPIETAMPGYCSMMRMLRTSLDDWIGCSDTDEFQRETLAAIKKFQGTVSRAGDITPPRLTWSSVTHHSGARKGACECVVQGTDNAAQPPASCAVRFLITLTLIILKSPSPSTIVGSHPPFTIRARNDLDEQHLL